MKKILVPFDFSEPANEAYKVAIQLAAQSKGEIVLLHALPLPILYTDSYPGQAPVFDPTFLPNLENDIKKELNKLIDEHAKQQVTVTAEVIWSELVSAVNSIVKNRNIDLVVMGTSGASGLREFLIGSNTEKVVRFSAVPVFAVRNVIDTRSIKNILLPSMLELNQHDFIKKLKDLQKFFDATLHVLLVNTPVNFRSDIEAKEALEEFARHYQLDNYKLHFRNYLHLNEGIVDFAYAEGINLIAMGTHARKGLAHLFEGSVTERVVNRAQIPVWTCCIKA